MINGAPRKLDAVMLSRQNNIGEQNVDRLIAGDKFERRNRISGRHGAVTVLHDERDYRVAEVLVILND